MKKLVRYSALAVGVLAVQPAMAADLSLDLNKLETQGGKCRSTMVVQNSSAKAAEVLKTDLVVFGADGVVSRRLAVELGPVPVGKTVVRIFDIPETACDAIGSILLNDVTQCRIGGETATASACLDALSVSSRTGKKFFK